MLQSSNTSSNFRAMQVAVFLGGCSSFMALFCAFFPLKLSLFLSGIPLFYAYLAYGNKCGLISSLITSTIIFAFSPIEIATDIFLNIFAPVMLLGYFSIQSITRNRKAWWYPESFLLRNFAILSYCSLIFLSLTFFTEETMLKATNDAVKILFKAGANSPNNLLIQQYIQSSVKYSVGMGMMIKMLFVLLNFHLAHLLSKRFRRNIRPKFDVSNLNLPNWMAVLPLVTLTVSYLVPSLAFISCGLFIVGLFPPAVNGFSIMHDFAKLQHKKRILIAFYLALLMMPLPIFMGTILLGIIDSFYPLRKKLIK